MTPPIEPAELVEQEQAIAQTHAPVVNLTAYDRSGHAFPPIDLDDIADVLAEHRGFVWLGLQSPGEDMLDRLGKAFNLHPLALEDARRAHQRPKIETFESGLFIVVHTAQVIESRVAFGETHIFVGDDFLITIRHAASLSYAPARERCERDARLLAHGPSAALYAVLDFIVDQLVPITAAFQKQLDEREQEIFAPNYSRGTVQRLYALKRELLRLRLAVSPLQDMLSQLVRLHPELIHKELRPYLRDVYDHAQRANDSIDAMREMLTAALSVNLSMTTIHQGEVVKRLAGWAALAAIPTLAASWYGMNFRHMPELSGRWSYAALLTATVTVCGWLYIKLKRNGWL